MNSLAAAYHLRRPLWHLCPIICSRTPADSETCLHGPSVLQVDIENTLEAVCDAVCSEPGQKSSVLRARAAALKSMGVIFQVRTANLCYSRPLSLVCSCIAAHAVAVLLSSVSALRP